MSPERRSTLVGAYATFVLFTAISGQFWRNLLGWWGFGAMVALALVGAIWLVATQRPDWTWRRTPKAGVAFAGLTVLSVAWSAYPGASAIGAATTLLTMFVGLALAICLPWSRLVAALAAALKWVLGLSLLFELVVAVFVRHAVLPLFPDFDPHAARLPAAFSWSRGLLLRGGPIEGILANRNLLAMAALLAVIVFGALLASGAMRRARGIGWLAVAVVMLALTRSATVIAAGVAVAVVLGFAIWARRRGPDGRRPVYWAAAATVVASVAGAVLFQRQLLALAGRSDDLTGRTDIWAAVIHLAQQRPWVGWGWVSYWAPWVEPFQHLAVRKGVTYLQAHDAWLDVWLQLGILGLVVFGAFVAGALWRSWFLAVDRPIDDAGADRPYSAMSLAPLLLLVALLGQSIGESRLLIEIGMTLLTAVAWSTKRGQWRPDPLAPRLPDAAALTTAPREATR